MQIRILLFGVLKDLVGRSTDVVDLPEGTRVKDLLSHYVRQAPRIGAILPSIACSVNEEYAATDRELSAGDEVALLPPVSGGAAVTTRSESNGNDNVLIVREPIATQAILSTLKRPGTAPP